jgi:hypothetical protein
MPDDRSLSDHPIQRLLRPTERLLFDVRGRPSEVASFFAGVFRTRIEPLVFAITDERLVVLRGDEVQRAVSLALVGDAQAKSDGTVVVEVLPEGPPLVMKLWTGADDVARRIRRAKRKRRLPSIAEVACERRAA